MTANRKTTAGKPFAVLNLSVREFGSRFAVDRFAGYASLALPKTKTLAGEVIMDVGAIGGATGAMGMAGMGAVLPTGGTFLNSSAAASGVAGSNPSGLCGMSGAAITPQMQNLVNAMRDFSSAEILMALMMMSASEKDDKKCGGGGGSAALGMLLGMSLGTQVGQMFGNMSFGLPGIGDVGASAIGGFSINLQA